MVNLKCFIIFISLIFLPLVTLACDCETLIGIDEADVVFTGQVLSVEDKGSFKISLKVTKIIKGNIQLGKLIIYTPCLSDACCGVGFEKGVVFKVYAFKEKDGEYHTNLCTATHRMVAK